MLDVLTLLLPKEKRELIKIGRRIFGNLDTKEERLEVIEYAKQMLADGRITVPEWSKFGGKLGILKNKKKK